MSAFDPSLDPQRMEQPLTDREKAVRDSFVAEYMKDTDPFRACVRMGFLHAFAIDQAKAFMQDGYVLRQIAWLQRQAVVPTEQDKAEQLANLRWLTFNGTAASRTAATKQYMEAQGYIKKDGDAEEERLIALANLLKGFSEQAPA